MLSPMSETSYKLDELAAAAGVSPRTVRYYVQRGLLPAPAFRGRDTAYSGEHLLRLRAIKRLQESFLPLDAIQAELERSSREELENLVAGGGKPRPPGPIPVPHDFPGVPPPYRAPSWLAATGERFVRYVLRPGLELHLSEGADAETRALFEKLLNEANDAEAER
jgi:DNA-binding transcriptional MerR regulator